MNSILKKIFSPISFVVFFFLIRISRYAQNNIVSYLPLINKYLGFDFIIRLLLFCDGEINIQILRYYGAAIGARVRTSFPLIVHADNNFERLVIGDNCHIGRDVFFDLTEKITVGSNVTISMRSSIITHIDVGDSNLRLEGFYRKEGDVVIKNNVYLGCGVTVLHGVTIGENSLIGAGAVVTADIPANSMAVGIPARVIRKIDGST